MRAHLETSYIHKCKTAAHIIQALFIFIAACVAIAVITKGGSVGGATSYYLALCFFSIPALLYLAMVPAWSRTQRFMNAWAFVALDTFYAIFWFAAFIAVAVWNSAGIAQGAKDKKLSSGAGNCSTFAYGSEEKCKLSEATVGLGVVIFILFILTTAISAYYLHRWRADGVIPCIPRHDDGLGQATSLEAQNKDVWSANTDEIDHPAHDSDDEDARTERGGGQEEDEYALLHSIDTEEGRHPGRPMSWGEPGYGQLNTNTEYRGAYDAHQPTATMPSIPNALSPGGYEEYRRNYSFSGGV